MLARRLLITTLIAGVGFIDPMLLASSSAFAETSGIAKTKSSTSTSTSRTTTRTAQATATTAARKGGAQRSLTADQLLVQAQRSLTLAVSATKKSPGAKSKKAAPFVKALGETARALKTLRADAAKRDKKRFARSLSEASRVVGRLNSTYRLSGLSGRELKRGMDGIGKSWPVYLKRVSGSKTAATPQTTRDNGRRIGALKKNLSGLRDRRSMSPSEVRELNRMLAALDRADRANREAVNQWLALVLLNEIFGWYGGYYDYIVVVEPEYAYYYRDDYVYWSSVAEYSDVQYESYYESYSFEYYEETIVVEETSYVEFTSEETTIIETEYESIETTTETLYEESESYTQLTEEATLFEEAEVVARSSPVVDPAEVENVEADAAAQLDESAPEIDPAVAPAVSADDGEPEDAAPADVTPAEEEAAPAADADAVPPAGRRRRRSDGPRRNRCAGG